jgi:tetratricopeptide (TPR) repeat protein
MLKTLRVLTGLAIVLVSAPPAHSTCGGGGGGGRGGALPGGSVAPDPARVFIVPWKIYGSGTAPSATPTDGAKTATPSGPGWILHWAPISAEQARASKLQVSRSLSLAASQCVSLALITPDNAALLGKLGLDGKTAAVILMDEQGKELGRVADQGKGIEVQSVEKLLTNAMDKREDELKKQLDEAKTKAAAGDKAGAIEIYQSIWAQRCVMPKPAKKAGKALKELGVIVESASFLELPDPSFHGPIHQRVQLAMRQGLESELKGHYLNARAHYAHAAQLDPADPTPLRYLGELQRHHTGEWQAAQTTFRKILDMPADPLSRAVALHGLGKMTIHAGEYEKGLALMQDSLAAFPLALTYRNLAVYWNEWDRKKADGYVQKAMELDPKDPYNLIFSATYMADTGRQAEALKIAKTHESLLSASYNLAAVYAVLGQKDKALAMLKRHFYAYERFDAVRTKEMQEARVDVVFKSLKEDPRFVALTAKADQAKP